MVSGGGHKNRAGFSWMGLYLCKHHPLRINNAHTHVTFAVGLSDCNITKGERLKPHVRLQSFQPCQFMVRLSTLL